MRNPFHRLSLLWKIVLSTSIAITVLFALTGWVVVNSATRATSDSINHEVQASFEAYKSLWKSRADRLASISAILSAMTEVRVAFGTGDPATIRDTASELWSRVSEDNAIFLVTNPRGQVIASLGGLESPLEELPAVREALPRFPAQSSGFIERRERLYHITITPVYVQTAADTALLDVLVAGYEINRAVAEHLKASTGGSEFLFLSHGRTVAATLPASAAAVVARQVSGSAPKTVRSGSTEYAPLVTTLTDIKGAAIGQLAILRSSDAARRQILALRRKISLLWLFSMAAGLGLTYLLARRIVEPVKALDRAAAEVARQNYDLEVVVESEDELGRLASTFNAMCTAIRRAREELIVSERISTIGRLAASIVHDLRNPLASVYGGAEMLMYSQLSQEQVERLARNMYQASRRIQKLLQDFLDVSQGKAGRLSQCDLRELVANVSESLAPAAEAHEVRVVVDVPEGLELTLDQGRMERVFANLMENALDAMPAGGLLTVSAASENGSVVVEVKDTGPGIAPEIRDRLFQPFVTSGKKTGLGLGLALSRQAVMDHGGEMWASTAPEGGACFAFRLPRNG